jgi:hypothetical protein
MATAQEELEKARSLSRIKYMFPKNRLENVRHKMMMNFYKFNFRVNDNLTTDRNSLANKSIGSLNNALEPSASIILPVPIKIIEKYDAQYASVDNVNLVSSAIQAMSSRSRMPDTNSSQFAVNAASALMNVAGVSINPYTAIRFKGMPLRRHNFRWKLSPESKENTDEIENIIKAISIRMHPQSAQPFGVEWEVVLRYPELINFRIIGAENPDHTFPTAPCVIDSFNVDRTGGDYPSFFKGTGTPVVYGMQMSVIEILPLIREDDTLQTITFPNITV